MSWESIKVQDFSEVTTGGTPSTMIKEYWDNGTIAWLNSGELNQDIITKCENYITKKGLENCSTRLMPKDTVLIALTGATTGVVGYLTFEACANQSVTGILPSKKHHPKFLYYYLKSIRNKVLTDAYGGAQKHISQGYVKDLEIPLPPLPIQKRIAEILDAADELKRKDQELLKKYDELAQAIFIDMFGDLIKNDKGWEISKIGKVCKIKGGKRLPLGDKLVKENTGLPYIKAGNIKGGKVTTDDLEYLLPITQTKIKNYTVKTGDVCVTIVGANIGDVGIVPEELNGANLTENAAKVMVLDKTKINNVYLSNYWSMPFVQSEVKRRAMAVGVPKLALFRIEEIEIPIPPYPDQLKFNSAIEVLNNHHNKSVENLKHSENLLQTLIQKAFNGELFN